jgi:hypothetical protein
MKVGQPGNSPVQNNEARSAKRGPYSSETQEAKHAERTEHSEKLDKADGAAKNGGSSGARAEISPKAREFSQAKAVASQAPDIREDRVADLKKRISEGSYRIDEDAIADRMVDEHLRGPRTA